MSEETCKRPIDQYLMAYDAFIKRCPEKRHRHSRLDKRVSLTLASGPVVMATWLADFRGKSSYTAMLLWLNQPNMSTIVISDGKLGSFESQWT